MITKVGEDKYKVSFLMDKNSILQLFGEVGNAVFNDIKHHMEFQYGVKDLEYSEESYQLFLRFKKELQNRGWIFDDEE